MLEAFTAEQPEMTLSEVARAAGITQASLSNYETGKRELPMSTALAIVSALDVTLGDIIDVGDVIVLRDSRLGRVVRTLMDRPDIAPSGVGEGTCRPLPAAVSNAIFDATGMAIQTPPNVGSGSRIKVAFEVVPFFTAMVGAGVILIAIKTAAP